MLRTALIAGAFLATFPAAHPSIAQTYVSKSAANATLHIDPISTPIPAGTTKENLYGLSDAQLAASTDRGRSSFLEYPAKKISLGVPYDSLSRLFATKHRRPLVRLGLRRNNLSDIGNSWCDVWSKYGLFAYPAHQGHGPYNIPFAHYRRPGTPIRNNYSKVRDLRHICCRFSDQSNAPKLDAK